MGLFSQLRGIELSHGTPTGRGFMSYEFTVFVSSIRIKTISTKRREKKTGPHTRCHLHQQFVVCTDHALDFSALAESKKPQQLSLITIRRKAACLSRLLGTHSSRRHVSLGRKWHYFSVLEREIDQGYSSYSSRIAELILPLPCSKPPAPSLRRKAV